MKTTYEVPKIEDLGSITDLTQYGANHAGQDGKYYENKGYFGSNLNGGPKDPKH